MGDNVFRFKHFEIRNERSAMKVNTDGVLLGAAVSLGDGDRRILDAGTGTGVIALILAQRMSEAGMDTRILGIDIDAPSAEEAGENFSASPWTGILEADATPLQACTGTFDLIVSNPPYYDASLRNPDLRKSTARHTAAEDEENPGTSSLSYRTLAEFASCHLSENGRLAVILPSDRESVFLRTARGYGLYPSRILRIRTVPRKAPARFIAELSRTREENISEEELTIQNEGRYTGRYTDLVKEFYLWA